MDFSWTCDALTGKCTASADLVAWAQNVMEGVWFLAGAVIAAAVVVSIAVILLRRV